jgi:hypothetical protein
MYKNPRINVSASLFLDFCWIGTLPSLLASGSEDQSRDILEKHHELIELDTQNVIWENYDELVNTPTCWAIVESV